MGATIISRNSLVILSSFIKLDESERTLWDYSVIVNKEYTRALCFVEISTGPSHNPDPFGINSSG